MKICSPGRIGNSLLGLILLVVVLGDGCGRTPDKRESFEDFQGIVRVSDDKKRITSLVGKGTKVYQGMPSQMASQFLNENVNRLGLPAGLGDLSLLSEKARSFGSNVEFQQTLNGLPVENGRIKVNFDKKGHVVHVVNSYTPPAGAVDQTSVGKERAAEIVINEFLRTTPHNPSKDEQQQKQQQENSKIVSRADLQLRKGSPRVDDVFFSRNGRLHRAYRISITADRPFGSKQFVVDANSAEIVQTKNFVYNSVDGEGEVFIPNPVNSLNDPSLFVFGPLSTVSTNNPNPYFTVPLRELEASTGPFTLRGRFVAIEYIEPPDDIPLPSKPDANDFKFTRDEPGFEEVMIYYHIDRMQRYIQDLGFTDVMNRRLSADAHGLFGAENSHYFTTPETVGEGYIAFGDGGVNDAEDADVIAHEYGHAIQDNQNEGAYSENGQPRAMGEGFGDYWAFSSYDKETIEHRHFRPCVMEWDVAPRDCRRRVDDGPRADSFNLGYTAWENGRIWSATLYAIFDLLKQKTTADRVILQSHFIIPSITPSFRDGADAIMTAFEEVVDNYDPLYSKKGELCRLFVDRNIYTASDCP